MTTLTSPERTEAIASPSRISRRRTLLIGGAQVAAVLGSRTFAAIVAVATIVQVCVDPIVGLISSAGGWEHPLPAAAVITLAGIGCALQAGCLLLIPARSVLAVIGTLASYLAVALLLGVPTWAQPMQLVVAASLFGVAASRPLCIAVLCGIGAVGIAVASLTQWAAASGAPASSIVGFVLTEASTISATAFAAVALGSVWAMHERRARRARERATRIARTRTEALEATRNAERGRIAQELHDVAGQHLAGLVSLCDASIQLAPAHPQQALELLEEVRSEGRYAAASLYGALGDLRSVDTGEQTPTPDLRHAKQLVRFWRERGMAATAAFGGDLEMPPTVVSTTAYRALQEGLSNCAKHAPGAAVTVSVLIGPRELRVSVTNGAPSRRRPTEAGLGLGWGLDNLRQKLALVDGELGAVATAEGGWTLGVKIPFPTMEDERG